MKSRLVMYLLAALLIAFCFFMANRAKADEQQYKITITIEKTCTLSEALKLAEKYGKEGKISINPEKTYPNYYNCDSTGILKFNWPDNKIFLYDNPSQLIRL